MQTPLPADRRVRGQTRQPLAKGFVAGAVAGLAGTVIMDLIGLAVLLIAGGPATLSFSLIGDAAARFFSELGMEMPGGTVPGVALHYLIGLVLGIIFGMGLSLLSAPRMHVHTAIGLGILFVQAASLPLLTCAAIVLQMTFAEAALYFGTSFVMHLVFGGALGITAAYVLRWERRSKGGNNAPD